MKSPMRVMLLLWLVLVSCAPLSLGALGVCWFPGAVGKKIRALGREVMGPTPRPDDAVREGDAGLWVSGAHDVGRLSLYFSGPPTSGTLPRDASPSDGGCEAVGQFVFLTEVDAGSATFSDDVVAATLTVTAGASVDGGTQMLFRVTDLIARRPDGGTRTVANRDLDVVVPP